MNVLKDILERDLARINAAEKRDANHTLIANF
ncbi:Uncharacterised protein [Proteus mirabilis]|uniref:Uncharacterized protein n=1 Tax=Proteus mirabilis TaxID=584 RepID=A0A379GGG0_PROMI|nr:Uncharacterised protein [Proteus mirabilis]